MYSFVLRRNDAISLLLDIQPYLVIDVKIKRAELILKKYKSLTPRNGRYTEEMLVEKEEFYNEFMGIK